MANRELAKRRTRESILDAAEQLFGPAWYDEVTLADVAARAGVSQQTVVNHFGSKARLYLTGLQERFVPAVTELRQRAVPGDVASIVDTLMDDYESSGDGTVRNAALAGRIEELARVIEGGRVFHRAFVERVFEPQLAPLRGPARELLVSLLVAVLDVHTWKQLRRDQGLDRTRTAEHLRTLVEAVLDTVAA
jgi:AcrR family transcriptional regulator